MSVFCVFVLKSNKKICSLQTSLIDEGDTSGSATAFLEMNVCGQFPKKFLGNVVVFKYGVRVFDQAEFFITSLEIKVKTRKTNRPSIILLTCLKSSSDNINPFPEFLFFFSFKVKQTSISNRPGEKKRKLGINSKLMLVGKNSCDVE